MPLFQTSDGRTRESSKNFLKIQKAIVLFAFHLKYVEEEEEEEERINCRRARKTFFPSDK